jgi:hypothetical protein
MVSSSEIDLPCVVQFGYMNYKVDESPQSQNQVDFGRAYQRFLNLPPTASLAVFNESQLTCLRPIALKLFSAPSSSASSERVFSQAGLIMRATRSRLSQIRLSHLVFLKCNKHLK